MTPDGIRALAVDFPATFLAIILFCFNFIGDGAVPPQPAIATSTRQRKPCAVSSSYAASWLMMPVRIVTCTSTGPAYRSV
jgi:hypothetical protein